MPAAPTTSASRVAAAGSGRSPRTLVDPEGHLDWVVEARVDLDASDAVGELVLTTTALRCLTDAR